MEGTIERQAVADKLQERVEHFNALGAQMQELRSSLGETIAQIDVLNDLLGNPPLGMPADVGDFIQSPSPSVTVTPPD